MVRRRISTGGRALAVADELGCLLGLVRQAREGPFMDSPPWRVVDFDSDALRSLAIPAQMGICASAFRLGVSSGISVHALVPLG